MPQINQQELTVGGLADSVSVTHSFSKPKLIFLNTSDIDRGRVLHRDYTSVATWPGQAKKSIRKGDILFSEIRPANGRYAFVDFNADDYVVSTKLMVIRPKPGKVSPRFLYHFLTSRKTTSWLQHLAESRSGTFPQITFDQVAELGLPCLTLREQRSIEELFDALDDKIEQNRRTARALERLARAIFRAWFVDFEPAKAKAGGATSFPSMPQEVFDALPTNFVESDIGPVPEGWEVKAVSEVFDVNPTLSLRKGELAPYLDMKRMPTNGHAPDSWTERPFGSGMRFMNGDTLVARITPCLENGKTAFVDFLDDGQIAWGSTEYIVLRPQPPLPPVFAYCLARTGEFRDFAIQNMTGTSGRQRVSPNVMDHFRLAVPSKKEVAAEFGEVVNPMFDCIRGGMEQSRKLATLRDYLLPKLLSGDVRVVATRGEGAEPA